MPAFGDRVRRGYGWRQGFQVLGRNGPAEAEVSDCGRILRIKGYLIDYVDAVEGPFENLQSVFMDSSKFSHMEEMAAQAFNRLHGNDLSNTSETTFMAFLKTLTANLRPPQNVEPSCDVEYDTTNLQGQLERLLRPSRTTTANTAAHERPSAFDPWHRGHS